MELKGVIGMAEGTEIINAIGSVGFPIVACCGLFWMINTTMKEVTTAINNLTNMIDDVGKRGGV